VTLEVLAWRPGANSRQEFLRSRRPLGVAHRVGAKPACRAAILGKTFHGPLRDAYACRDGGTGFRGVWLRLSTIAVGQARESSWLCAGDIARGRGQGRGRAVGPVTRISTWMPGISGPHDTFMRANLHRSVHSATNYRHQPALRRRRAVTFAVISSIRSLRQVDLAGDLRRA